jgi:hypothetical protein
MPARSTSRFDAVREPAKLASSCRCSSVSTNGARSVFRAMTCFSAEKQYHDILDCFVNVFV